MGNDNHDIIELMKQRLAEVKRQGEHLEAAIALLERNGSLPPPPENRFRSSAGVIPPIVDIVKFLGQQMKPMSQAEIIRFVGDIRQERYPTLFNHYKNVWRALEYHCRHNKLIVCVDEEGREANVKPLPRRPKGKRLTNSPEYYDQDNWFRLKDQPAEKAIAADTTALRRAVSS